MPVLIIDYSTHTKVFEKGSVATLADRWWAHRHWARFLIARGHGAVAEIVKSYSYFFYNICKYMRLVSGIDEYVILTSFSPRIWNI